MKTNIKHKEQLSLGELLRQKLDENYMTNTLKIDSTQSCDNAVIQRQFIVGSVDVHGNVSFASNPVVHTSHTLARAECKRLAKLNPGRTFLFVQLTGAERVRVEPTTVSL